MPHDPPLQSLLALPEQALSMVRAKTQIAVQVKQLAGLHCFFIFGKIIVNLTKDTGIKTV